MKCRQIEGRAVVQWVRTRGIMETELAQRVYKAFGEPGAREAES